VDFTLIKDLIPQGYTSTLYSGYLNPRYTTKQYHYVFQPSESEPQEDPLLLWLNGGPGCSSLLGFLQEIGPLIFPDNSTTLEWNQKYNWNKRVNLLFFEGPIGVGFSTGKYEDVITDDTVYANDNLKILIEFYKKFPALKKNPLYLTGESYAGVYLPFLAENIYKYNANPSEPFTINLKGMLIINGVTDQKHVTWDQKFEFMYQRGIINKKIKDRVDYACRVLKNKNECTFELERAIYVTDDVNSYDYYGVCYKHTDNVFYYFDNGELIDSEEEESLGYFGDLKLGQSKLKLVPKCINAEPLTRFFKNERVRKAFHIPPTVKPWEICSNIKYTKNSLGSIQLYPSLIKSGLKIMIVAGDTDILVNPYGVMSWIRELNQKEGYKVKKPWIRWFTTDSTHSQQVAGFIEEFDSLTYVSVLGAGHMVPQWKRAESYRILDYFIFDVPL
jgi:carboxypeptidase C (cathepsin A)